LLSAAYGDGNNVPFASTEAGTYTFTFTAKDKESPTLSVSYSQ